MKKYVVLFSGADNKSYFKDEMPDYETEEPLGIYSKKIAATGLRFRKFKAGAVYDWHNAPQPQYIVYLEGEVQVEASGGETRIFKPGDVLFATDLIGKGHISKTLSDGRSIIITTRDITEENNIDYKMIS